MLTRSGWAQFFLLIAHGNADGVGDAPQHSLRLVPTASSIQCMKCERERHDR